MTSLMETAVGELLVKARILKDADAWLQAMTPDLNRVILTRWIQQDQLFTKGIDADNKIIGLYSVTTEIISRGRKRAGEPFTLYDTGDFYRSMFIDVLRDSFIVGARSGSYYEMLDQYWWRVDILGLTDENLQKLIEAVKIKYRSYVLRVLQLN